MLMYLNLYSTDPDTDQKDLFNYSNVYVMPVLKRIQGMGIPTNLGNRNFAMRIWLNPERMRAYNVSVEDVMEALAEQSIIGSPGRLGQATGMTSQSKEYVLTYVGRYNKPDQYENIVLRANADGEILRLKDVCVPPLGDGAGPRSGVELGSEFFDIYRWCSSRRPDRTPRRSSRRSSARSRNCGRRSRPGWTTRSPTTSPSSSARRSTRSCTRCSRRSSWCPWSCSCSSATCARR
eukprot:Skav214841  [mRNA]  locus=scaffold7779:48:752:+ [translate_table: standard]